MLAVDDRKLGGPLVSPPTQLTVTRYSFSHSGNIVNCIECNDLEAKVAGSVSQSRPVFADLSDETKLAF